MERGKKGLEYLQVLKAQKDTSELELDRLNHLISKGGTGLQKFCDVEIEKLQRVQDKLQAIGKGTLITIMYDDFNSMKYVGVDADLAIEKFRFDFPNKKISAVYEEITGIMGSPKKKIM